ncbi:MAG: 50S ribosomal protein L25 [Planctomycetes bacterium]|nr:50S ribosomal protein L25 [Planctomycetota bacterium]
MSTTFATSPRTSFGSKSSQASRAEGQIPVTISRKGADSQHVLVAEKDAELLVASVPKKSALTVDGAEAAVVIKKVERDVLTDRLVHIDLIGVSDDTEVVIDIPVVPNIMNCPGIKAGGLMEQSLRKVAIRCKAKDLPSSLDVVLDDINVGDTVYVKRCKLPEGASFVTKPDVAMITVLMTRSMKKGDGDTEEEGGAAEA